MTGELVRIESDKGLVCRRILEALPDWFGIPEAVEYYVRDVEALPMIGWRDGGIVGFAAMKAHNPTTVELFLIGFVICSQVIRFH